MRVPHRKSRTSRVGVIFFWRSQNPHTRVRMSLLGGGGRSNLVRYKYLYTRRNDPWIWANKVWNTQKWGWKSILFNQSYIHPRWIISVLNHFVTLPECSEAKFDKMEAFSTIFQSQIFDYQRLCLPIRLGAPENMSFHGLQNMFGASSIWAFWVQYCRQNKFMHSLETLPFRIFN